MSTITKTDTEKTFASRWWKYFSNLWQTMDFDSLDYTYASIRQLRQAITTLEARVSELESGMVCCLKNEPHRLT
ncbi:MAG: hypothetical protein ACI8QT_000406 [Halioglobus sp.]|jgi:hypothetical protein